jgi:DNA-binding NarL/FixJ family response regulator
MLRDIISDAINFQSDMELIDCSGGSDLSKACKSSGADIVIVARPTEPAASHQRILVDNPQLKMLVVTDDGREAHLLEFRQMPVTQLSPQGLVDAIRAAVVADGTSQRDR